MIVGIHQPNYLPWLGYFRKIALCDVFVFFDHAQLPGGSSFVTRNRIKTANGELWLAVPITSKGSFPIIADAQIANHRWVRKHLLTLSMNYGHSRWKSLIEDEIAPILMGRHEYLADLNIALIKSLCKLMGIEKTVFLRATAMNLRSGTAESIPEILEATSATVYATGSGAGMLRYLDEEKLLRQGVETYFVPSDFPQYPQNYGEFRPSLSIVDALLNVGPEETARLLKADGGLEQAARLQHVSRSG